MSLADPDLAREFAARAHAAVGQKRKYTGEDYIVHPIEVAELVRSVPHTRVMLCASYLHDVIEDANITADEIARLFGHDVAEHVVWLTNITTLRDGNRAARKSIERRRLAAAPGSVQTVKTADIISNVSSIFIHDPSYARIYVPEKIADVEAMTAADPFLRARASHLLERVVNDLRGRDQAARGPLRPSI